MWERACPRCTEATLFKVRHCATANRGQARSHNDVGNMNTLLIRNAHSIATFDAVERELRDASIFIRDNVIEAVGPASELPQTADEVIDASNCVVTPGLVNTHHHMYQSLTRTIPGVQDAELFTWLKGLYPIWARMTADMVHTSALTAMAELLLSGCTTSSDHLYLFPNGSKLDDTIAAATQLASAETHSALIASSAINHHPPSPVRCASNCSTRKSTSARVRADN